jgi:hypothetical protein
MGFARARMALSAAIVMLGAALAAAQAQRNDGQKVPSFEEAMAADTDVWAEAALRQPGGPSYEFFEKLIPPLRYVDAPFRHYPINLSAPGAMIKARLLSNGSQINALARQPNWNDERGIPVTIRVGLGLEVFGDTLDRLTGPKFEQGYLPIVQMSYHHERHESTYTQEVFAPTDPVLVQYGTLFARFGMTEGKEGKIELQFEGSEGYSVAAGVMRDRQNAAVAVYDPQEWEYNSFRNVLVATPKSGQTVTIAIFTQPYMQPLLARMNESVYDAQRQRCIDDWNALLEQGMQVSVNEQRINDSWRTLMVGNFMLLTGDEIRYSAGNQYAKIYIAEGGDATRCFALWGYTDAARRMMIPLFTFTRARLEYHQAALKLQMLAHYYRLTRDADFIRNERPRWQHEIDVILNGREKDTGLLPPEKYAGDIEDLVYSANSNSNAWRALRDWSVILAELGETKQAQRLDAVQKEFRKAVLAAIEKSIRRDSDPPFVPIALLGDEDPPPAVYQTLLGSYWGLMAPYVLGSGIFSHDSEYADAIINFIQKRGGSIMGLTAVRPGESFWVEGRRTNDLYGLRYNVTLLQRDQADLALVTFYAKLAQGLTRDTLIGAEGVSLVPVDRHGRQMYLPPNSGSNANWLWLLRYLLVQDWDMDDDGQYDTLRLAFATPQRWLDDGGQIKVERAPTAFGPVSYTIDSRLSAGEVIATIDLPERSPGSTLLRLRLPDGWRITAANLGDQKRDVKDDGTIDLSGLNGSVKVRATVARQ